MVSLTLGEVEGRVASIEREDDVLELGEVVAQVRRNINVPVRPELPDWLQEVSPSALRLRHSCLRADAPARRRTPARDVVSSARRVVFGLTI